MYGFRIGEKIKHKLTGAIYTISAFGSYRDQPTILVCAKNNLPYSSWDYLDKWEKITGQMEFDFSGEIKLWCGNNKVI